MEELKKYYGLEVLKPKGWKEELTFNSSTILQYLIFDTIADAHTVAQLGKAKYYRVLEVNPYIKDDGQIDYWSDYKREAVWESPEYTDYKEKIKRENSERDVRALAKVEELNKLPKVVEIFEGIFLGRKVHVWAERSKAAYSQRSSKITRGHALRTTIDGEHKDISWGCYISPGYYGHKVLAKSFLEREHTFENTNRPYEEDKREVKDLISLMILKEKELNKEVDF